MKKLYAYIDHTTANALVERPAPGLAPSAFRIWSAGRNEADDGEIFFTRRSAELLLNEQAARARVYSSDFDHLSLQSDRPATSGRASGWHSLEVRPDAAGEPELWAINIEWCADAKCGLEADPPQWRFFSPAFDIDPKTKEVVSYINFALCINPMTHGLPALAAHSEKQRVRTSHNMKNSEMAARLRAMAEAADDASKKEAYNLAAAAIDDMKPDDDKEPEAKSDDAEAKKSGEETNDPKDPDSGAGVVKSKTSAESTEEKPDDEKKESKKAAATAATVTLAVAATDTAARLERLEIKELLAERADLPEATRKWCLTQPRKVVESFLSQAAKQMATRATTSTKGQDGPALLEGDEREAMDRAMGIKTHSYTAPEKRSDGSFVLHTVRPSAYRAHVAQKGQA